MYKPDFVIETPLARDLAFQRTLQALKVISTITKVDPDNHCCHTVMWHAGKPSWLEVRVRKSETTSIVEAEAVGYNDEKILKRFSNAFEHFDDPKFIDDSNGFPPLVNTIFGVLVVLCLVGFVLFGVLNIFFFH